ncbi:MAG: cytochrome c [Gemmatimonadota bacterium]
MRTLVLPASGVPALVAVGAGPGRCSGPKPSRRRFAGLGALAASLLLGLPAPLRAQAGPELASALGCGACHAGMPEPGAARTGAPALGPGAPPLEAAFVFAYLADPAPRRPELAPARMPDFRLDEGERLALALHLGTEPEALADVRARHPQVDAARGARIYDVLGCAGCHASPNDDALSPQVGPDLSREGARVRGDWLRGFLVDPAPVRGPAHATAPGARMPDFRLSAEETEALADFLERQGQARAEAPAALTPFAAARTRRLFEDRAACLGCHVAFGEGGGLAPPLSGLAARLRPGFVVEMIRDPQAAAPGAPMPQQAVAARDAEALAALLLSDPSPRPEGVARSLADPTHPAWTALAHTEVEGAALYARWCASCHGADGRSNGWNAATLPTPPAVHADPERMGARPDDTLYDGIHAGAWVLDGSPRMPPFGSLLDDAQIRALVAYIRTLCACTQPAWAGEAPDA